MNKKIKKVIPIVMVGGLLTFSCPLVSEASNLTIKGSSKAQLYGFVDYEMGWFNKTLPTLFKSNTSYKWGDKGKTSFESQAQVRIGIKVKSPNKTTMSNLTVDSWPDNKFNLFLAFIKQRIGKNLSLIIGKDWSLVDQRYFSLSSLSFKPYPAGFQGSKRTAQFQISYVNSTKNIKVRYSFAFENRDSKDGVVVGENESPTGKTISNSDVSLRKIFPFAVGNIKVTFRTTFGSPSNIMAFYETSPVYLIYAGKEKRKSVCLYGLASTLNIGFLSLTDEYIYTKGLTGVAGVRGNGLKTYSFIYTNDELIERKSTAWGVELAGRFNRKRIALGFVNLKFRNVNASNDDFLKNEVKKVKTYYVTAIDRITRQTALFAEFDRVRTTYSLGDGKFDKAWGSQILIGYRFYF